MEGTNMEIQLAPENLIDGAINVWHTEGEGVDIVMDILHPEGLKLKRGSVKNLYAFHVLGQMKPMDVQVVLNYWKQLLAPDGVLYIIEQDSEYVFRALCGGDITIEVFNDYHRRNTFLNKDKVTELLANAGFNKEGFLQWRGQVKFEIKDFELVLSAKNL